MKTALVFVHIFILHRAPQLACCQQWIRLTLFAGSLLEFREWLRVFNLIGWRELIRTALLVPPGPVTKIFFLSSLFSTHILSICFLNLFQSCVSVWTPALRLQVCKHKGYSCLSPWPETPCPQGNTSSPVEQFLCQLHPTSCQKHSLTAPARNYEDECAEDDSQYSSPALLCTRENMLAFSQQLLQFALVPECPTWALAQSFSHTVFSKDGNLLAEVLCAQYVIQHALHRPPLVLSMAPLHFHHQPCLASLHF